MSVFKSAIEYKVYRGAFLSVKGESEAHFERDGLVVVGVEGTRSGQILRLGSAMEVAAEWGLDLCGIPVQTGLFLPAFYDLHFHWVQDSVREMPKASLLDWLENYTFPAEAKFADREYAEQMAESFWKRILSVGTVGGLCYSSIHEAALEAAMERAPEGFRIGNVLMTMNCPEYLRQTEAAAIAGVRAGAARYGERYVASPRFAPTTSASVMVAAAEAARAHGCFQQTHLAETRQEIDWVLGIYRKLPGFGGLESYTDIYRRVGMLGPQTVFGHCIHLDDQEWEHLAESQSIIASCPSSNAPIEDLGLGSGLFDFQKAAQYGVLWSLCSDIGGGPFLSMFDVMRSFVSQNQNLGDSGANYVQALFRSTRMGAVLLGLEERKGLLEDGFDFDCIRVAASGEVLDSGDPEHILAAVIEGVEQRRDYDSLVEETWWRGQSCFKRAGAASF